MTTGPVLYAVCLRLHRFCFAWCVSGLRPDGERNIAQACCCVVCGGLGERNIAPARQCDVCVMALVKEKPHLLGEIGAKTVILGEQGRLIFHVGRRNPEQARYFFLRIPIVT